MFPRTSRKTSPSSHCYRRGGNVGCYTTGWQDHIEVYPWISRRLQRGDPNLATRIQRLFKRHTQSIPSFLGEGYEHASREDERDDFLRRGDTPMELFTLCTSGAPHWDLDRPGDYATRLQCNLYTVLTNI